MFDMHSSDISRVAKRWNSRHKPLLLRIPGTLITAHFNNLTFKGEWIVNGFQGGAQYKHNRNRILCVK